MKLLKIFPFVFIVMLVVVGCTDDFEEMNTHPSSPTETSANFLFNGILQPVKHNSANNQVLYLNNHRAYNWSQLSVANWDEDQNEIHDLGRDAIWNNYYGTLRNIRELDARLDDYAGDAERVINRRAMLYVIWAYQTLRNTDTYGAMPYSEAGLGATEGSQIFRPKYDDQQSVYTDALAKLRWASENIKTDASATTPGGETYLNYGVNETLFGNDMAMWQKLANSLLLRYGMRISNVDQAKAQELVSYASGKPTFDNNDEMLAYGNNWNEIGGNSYWGWEYFYEIVMGENVWNHMSENDNTDGSGIIDPRVHIYFEVNKDSLWVAAPQNVNAWDDNLSTGDAYNVLRRQDPEGFEHRGDYSAFNFYLVEDTDFGMDFHVTYSEVCFLKAEAIEKGWASGDAKEWYEKGVRSSVERWYTWGRSHVDWATPPEMPDAAALDAFLAHPMISYDMATDKLQAIHTQRWVDLFLNPQEAWHLFLRSGKIPSLTRENTVTGAVLEQARRIVYPEDERNNNIDNYTSGASMQGGDEFESRLWWDKN